MAGTTEPGRGSAGSGSWSTSVQITKLDGGSASVCLDVYDGSGNLQRALHQQYNALLSQILKDPACTRLDGYMRVRATDPIAAIVLCGDSTNQFLSAVPGISR